MSSRNKTSGQHDVFEIAPGWELVVVPSATTVEEADFSNSTKRQEERNWTSEPGVPLLNTTKRSLAQETARANYALVEVSSTPGAPESTTPYLSFINFTGRVVIRHSRRTANRSENSSPLPDRSSETTDVLEIVPNISQASHATREETGAPGDIFELWEEEDVVRANTLTPQKQDVEASDTLVDCYSGEPAPAESHTPKGLDATNIPLGQEQPQSSFSPSAPDKPDTTETRKAALTEDEPTTAAGEHPRWAVQENDVLVRSWNLGPFSRRRILAGKSMLHAIPDSVRKERTQQRQKLRLSGGAPTELHELCVKDHITLEEVLDSLERDPNQVQTKDANGRLPLHLIADNSELLRTARGRETAHLICQKFVQLYPLAIVEKDDDGMLPFFQILHEWVDWTGTNTPESVPHFRSREYSERTHYPSHSKAGSSLAAVLPATLRRCFCRVTVWEEADWCLTMLGIVLLSVLNDTASVDAAPPLRERNMEEMTSDRESAPQHIRTSLVNQLVEKIPNLLPATLLIDDDGQKTRLGILQVPILQMLLLHPDSVGSWIGEMLNHGGVPASRAIDFLWLVSEATPGDYAGGLHGPTTQEKKEFEEAKAEVMQRIASSEGTIASIIALEQKEIERATSSPVVWYALNTTLARPFVFGLVLLDISLHFALMIAFRAVLLNSTNEEFSDVTRNHSLWVAQGIGMQYLIRITCEIMVFASFSSAVLMSLVDLWFVFDLLTVLAVLSTSSHVRNNPDASSSGLFVMIIFLLWIKVMSFLKVVNQDLSTFISSVLIIISKLKYFTVVFVVYIVMFGDMFSIALRTREGGDFCAGASTEGGPLMDFCEAGVASYFRIYSIVLGDIPSLSELTETRIMELLFLGVTFSGIIVLLNVLIAVVSDSFEESKGKRMLIFSRSRAFFVAKNQSLEALLIPGSKIHLFGSILLARLVRWFVLVSILGTTVLVATHLVLESFNGSRTRLVLLFWILIPLMAVGLWIVIFHLVHEAAKEYLIFLGTPVGFLHWIERVTKQSSVVLAQFIFGLKPNDEAEYFYKLSESEQNYEDRASQLEHVMKCMILETKKDILEQFADLKKEMANKPTS